MLAADLYITEFMASNSDTIVDGFGDSSDWIELFNDGPTTIDLDGHYLTDDATDLTKWRIPAVDLAPGQTIVIFASSQDTVLSSGELHTNFKLSAAGEYLGLVDTDGTTVLQDFGAAYPAQFEDVSYGLEMETSGTTTNLVSSGDTVSAFIPTNGTLGTTWTESSFDDSSWTINGPSPIGYESSPGDYAGLIETTLPSNATGVYVRYEFDLTSLANISSLELGVRYDDGFVAYLNGNVIAEVNVPDTVFWNSFAAGNHPDEDAVNFETFDVSTGANNLQLGPNVLAIHGLNVSDTSSDILFDAELVAEGVELIQPIQIGYQESPSPGGANGESFLGFNSPVEFSLDHGFYDTTQSLTLTTSNPGSIIVYTTDGSDPLSNGSTIQNGLLYTNPISVSQTSVIRAAAFKPDFQPTPSVTQSYFFLDDVLGQQPNGEVPGPGWANGNVNGQDIDYGMDPNVINQYGTQAVKDALTAISTFSITTEIENLFDANTGIYVNAQNGGRSWERPASVELIHPDGSGGFQINAGLRIRGGFSRNDFNPKHAFRFYFRGEYGATKLDHQLFEDGASSYDVLDLRTAQNYSWSSEGGTENTFLREVWSRDLQRDLEHPFTRSQYHHLYINGVYWGLFQTQERVHDFYGEQYLGGDRSDYDVVKSGLRDVGGTEIADGNDEQWRDLFDLGQGLAQNPVGNADNYFTMQGLHPDGTRDLSTPVLVDMTNLIDYMLILFYTGNRDSGLSDFIGNNFANNWFGINDRTNADQGFQFFAHDAEHSLGAGNTDTNDRTGPFNNGNQDNYAQQNPQYLHQDLLASEEYRLAFADRIHKHFFNDGEFTPAKNIARWDERKDVVEDVILAESVRWGDSKTEPARTPVTWTNEVNTLPGFFNTRFDNTVFSQLIGDGLYPSVDPPALNMHGGSVPFGFPATLTSSGGTIYYTTDGSDPRLPGGIASNTAQPFLGGAISITADTTIKARVLSNSVWSALTEADFTLNAAAADGNSLKITELHFNPADPTAAELAAIPGLDNDDFEFLEVQNVSSSAISLSDVTLNVGTPLSLPASTLFPGDYALIVANQTAFELRYGTGLPIVAVNTLSSLANGGELVTLLAADNSTIHSFIYDDIDNWPSLADGQGASMEVIDTNGDYGDPLNWLPSRDVGGTPGSADPLLASPSSLRVTEIMYNPVVGTGSEFMELINSGTTTIDLANYRLIEGVEFDFTLASSTMIAPGERIVIATNAAEFNSVYGNLSAVVGVFASGSLANGGERILLVDELGDLIHDFVYDDEGLWPTSPDGGGFALEIIDLNGDYSDPLNWQPSAIVGGTPGAGSTTGDFNGDGQLDCQDINELTTAVANASANATYDVDANGLIDSQDVAFWITDLKGTLLGDANLDFAVDGVDFVVWNGNKFTASSNWCDGDFNGDGNVNGADFVIWNSNKFNSADARIVAQPQSTLDGSETSAERPLRNSVPRMPAAEPPNVSASADQAIALFQIRSESFHANRRAMEAAPRHDEQDELVVDAVLSNWLQPWKK
jgi:hypothetical protein